MLQLPKGTGRLSPAPGRALMFRRRAALGLVGPSPPRQDSRLSKLATTSSAPIQPKTSSSSAPRFAITQMLT
ncbi:hypothetical protein HPB49_006015 [Dermacentor silvarum]|uniref:Uncharacterized protein n=1 Tax=Dermacentor silvarum TaxID=543639 RepID=A0ACB8DB86_DERSI|nr:hypothetical protein HPB49_006015 [Dermacentor silvarum]